MEVFKRQTSFDQYFTLFETYENSSIHRLENLIILFTKQYVFQTKMRSSRPSTMVLINVFTKISYIEHFLLLKKPATILITTNVKYHVSSVLLL